MISWTRSPSRLCATFVAGFRSPVENRATKVAPRGMRGATNSHLLAIVLIVALAVAFGGSVAAMVGEPIRALSGALSPSGSIQK